MGSRRFCETWAWSNDHVGTGAFARPAARICRAAAEWCLFILILRDSVPIGNFAELRLTSGAFDFAFENCRDGQAACSAHSSQRRA
jgi:hypothetical protein